ncbi:MAG: hypothetical protein QNI92_01340 [Desulfobacterales bacterium]|nr:hypothetical protein [Desulfobacterales bacterium]MDJ0915067.1 hypothetical protein [Desulfobacterales bacterium]
MAILLTQEWDIIRGKEEEYEEFVENEFIPRGNAMGLTSVGGFYVEVGFGPRIISLKTAKDIESLFKAFFSKEFKQLIIELLEYITNYGNRILLSTGRVTDEDYKIQKGVWKYIQYYDKLPGHRKAYADFIVEEYLPALAQIDYLEVTNGWNVVLGGISNIVAELTLKSSVDVGRLLDDPVFRKVTEKLRRKYVHHYSSRIIRTTERFEQPRWYRL